MHTLKYYSILIPGIIGNVIKELTSKEENKQPVC